MKITQERLKEVLFYDDETGIFTRKIALGCRPAGSIVGTNMRGYLNAQIDGRNYFLHRLAWLYVFGAMPEKQIDHKNGIKNDNRISNLREANNSQNGQNQRKPGKLNSSGFLGVSFHKKSGKWSARIAENKKTRNLGLFSAPEEAHRAYLTAKRELHEFCTI